MRIRGLKCRQSVQGGVGVTVEAGRSGGRAASTVQSPGLNRVIEEGATGIGAVTIPTTKAKCQGRPSRPPVAEAVEGDITVIGHPVTRPLPAQSRIIKVPDPTGGTSTSVSALFRPRESSV